MRYLNIFIQIITVKIVKINSKHPIYTNIILDFAAPAAINSAGTVLLN